MTHLVSKLSIAATLISVLGSAAMFTPTASAQTAPALKPSMTDYSAAQIQATERSVMDRTIGLARLDRGRLIHTPFAEQQRWAIVSSRIKGSLGRFARISPTQINQITAAYDEGGQESENKLDEIRMAAADKNIPYVLVYGASTDAKLGAVDATSKSKAILLNSYSGKVLGTVTSNNTDYGQSDLTYQVEKMLSELSSVLGTHRSV